MKGWGTPIFSRSLVHRRIAPTTRILLATSSGTDRDVILVQGIEPSTRWRSFTIELLEFAQSVGVSTFVTLGALLADVPHTRPLPINATSEHEDMIHRYDLEASKYEGPTGIVGVLADAAAQADLPRCPAGPRCRTTPAARPPPRRRWA